jgi:4-amino-4-deoxy-L-arabinose transferase-like glycosyltransferase
MIDGPRSRLTKWTVVVLLLLGTFLLLYKFPAVPVGLHQDEMSEAYEAYSLLHTGADRWGYHLPVYFLSWGSGQNVLQSYLTIPVVAVLGLTRLSARLIPILCGLLTLPLFFLTVRRWCGDAVALLALLFLVLSPWHIMLSRWGTENSPLPFFLILGVYLFGLALDTGAVWLIVLSLVPFALAEYTYGVMVVVAPVLVPLLLAMRFRCIRRQGPAQQRGWVAALVLFALLSLPLGFFTVKNYVTKKNYSFETHLPFTVPLLPATRLQQAHNEMTRPTVVGHNIHFIGKGLSDRAQWYMPWFQLPDVLPVPVILLAFALLGMSWVTWRAWRDKTFHEPFMLWLVASVPLLFLIPLTISRATEIFLPLLALAAIGCAQFVEWLWGRSRVRALVYVVMSGCAVAFLLPTVRFLREYYGPAYVAEATPTFNPKLPEALQAALRMAMPGTPIYVTHTIYLNYVQVLFLTHVDPHVFQTSGATITHPDFGQYRFSRDTLAQIPGSFVFLVKDDDVEQWNVRYALDARLQRPELTSAETLQGWNRLLPKEAAEDLNERLRAIGVKSLPEVTEAAERLAKDETLRVETTPVCAVPEQVVAMGQFLVGRCP